MVIDYKSLGRRVRATRRRKGLTQEDAAELTGLSPTHISNIETGNTKLSLPTIVKIANIFEVSVDSLLCDSISKSGPALRKEIAEICVDCTEKEIKMVEDIIKPFKEIIRKKYT